jgi:hypothetical protein
LSVVILSVIILKVIMLSFTSQGRSLAFMV